MYRDQKYCIESHAVRKKLNDGWVRTNNYVQILQEENEELGTRHYLSREDFMYLLTEFFSR